MAQLLAPPLERAVGVRARVVHVLLVPQGRLLQARGPRDGDGRDPRIVGLRGGLRFLRPIGAAPHHGGKQAPLRAAVANRRVAHPGEHVRRLRDRCDAIFSLYSLDGGSLSPLFCSSPLTSITLVCKTRLCVFASA
eukprot:scaffold99640_cov78-Phaeocystis_antarctica.AAC.3